MKKKELNIGPLKIRQDIAGRHDAAVDRRGFKLCAHLNHVLNRKERKGKDIFDLCALCVLCG